MKILWLTNIPSPYRVNFFNELGKLCKLTVLFEKAFSDERDGSWKNFNTNYFEAIFLKGINIGVAEAFCPKIIQYIKKNTYDFVIVTNFSDLTGILATMTLQIKKIPYILESDGGFAGNGKGLKEQLKKMLLSRAQLYFSTAKAHDDYYLTYGAKKNKLVRYPFTSLSASDILKKPVSEKKKKMLRQELGMLEEKIILAVGQFIHRKGYDLLIQAMAQLDVNIGCYIVGGKPPQEYLDLVRDSGAKNVHFVDFKEKPELERYYLAADAFVHPTREDIWGLVVNEAMAKGLPVVTTDRCIAGLELVKPEIGRIVPADNVDLLARTIKEVLLMVGTVTSKNVLSVIRKYTFEEMAKIHFETLEKYYEREK